MTGDASSHSEQSDLDPKRQALNPFSHLQILALNLQIHLFHLEYPQR